MCLCWWYYRVQAPGLAITDVVQAARASAAQAAMLTSLISAWQVGSQRATSVPGDDCGACLLHRRAACHSGLGDPWLLTFSMLQAALPAISSALADDEVLDVVAARTTRVVLLTNRHLAYLYVRRHTGLSARSPSFSAASSTVSVTYRLKWIIRNNHIDNIRGLDRSYAVNVEYHKPVKLGRLSLKLPLHKGMRTATAEGHKDLIFRLNRHIGRSSNSGGSGSTIVNGTGEGVNGVGTNVQDLRIMMLAAAGAPGVPED